MSDCGVCISNYGDGECTGYRCVIVKAGQDWVCSECDCNIPKGARYELASWFYADREGFGNCKTCIVCSEICEAFQCHGRWHGSNFWDSMESAFPKLTTACFDRLRTPEAKAELQRRWMEWKGLAA
jgi:hypothetical protein